MQPSPTDPAAPAAPGAPLDIDLYCLRCGYNLRGLSGVLVRCPECGEENAIELVTETAPLISAHIARVESTLNLGALCCMLLIPLGAFAISSLILKESAANSGFTCMADAAILALWLFALSGYCRLTRGVARRSRCVVAYTCGALGWCALVALGPLWPWLVFENRYQDLGLQMGLSLASVAATVVLIVVFLRPYQRWIRGQLDPLKREVAVRFIAECLRSRDHANRARGPQEARADADEDRRSDPS
ncbi:MAG: hypothetical protein ACKVS9_06980 [Phycisphaerae bacterium]